MPSSFAAWLTFPPVCRSARRIAHVSISSMSRLGGTSAAPRPRRRAAVRSRRSAAARRRRSCRASLITAALSMHRPQLPDVARPRVGLELPHRRRRSAGSSAGTRPTPSPGRTPASSGMSSGCSRSGGTRIWITFSRKQQVLAEPPGLHVLVQVAVRRGDDPHVHLHVRRSPRPGGTPSPRSPAAASPGTPATARRPRRGTACPRRPAGRGRGGRGRPR